MVINIPNSLTLLRVFSIPVVILLHVNGLMHMSFLVLVFGLLTDFFDGRLARKLNQETHFGALFDPLADKFVALSFYGYIGYTELAPIWFVVVIWLRNFSQLLSVPILIWWLKKTFFVKPKLFSKWATAISDIFIFFPLFLLSYLNLNIESLFVPMVIIATVEIYILITYIPRLYSIAKGTRNTFT